MKNLGRIYFYFHGVLLVITLLVVQLKKDNTCRYTLFILFNGLTEVNDLASLPHELLGLQVEQLELEVDQVPDLVVAD